MDKKFKGGHNYGNGQARILNLLTNDFSGNKKHIYEVYYSYINK
jgi:hypothetical protein